MMKSPFFAVVILLVLATLAVAEINSITISDDSRPVILLQKFGFTQTGHVTISISSSSSQNPSRTGFYLVEEEMVLRVDIELQKNPSFCVLDSHYVHHFDQSYQVTSPGVYSLFFASCVPGTKVSMKFQTEMYNLDPNGSKYYLPAGSTQLPGLFFVLTLCYLTFFGLWVYLCYNKKQRIHVLIAALLLTKALSLVCAAEVKHYVSTTGTPHGWSIPFYVFQFMANVLLFMVIVLVGTGWSLLKPKLQEKEKKLLMMVIPFEVISTIGSVVIGETGPYVQNWLLWTYIFLFAEVCCWVAMRWVIVLWMCFLRKTSRKTVITSPFFGKFYSLVFVYLIFTRVGVLALREIVDYKDQWVSNAAGEIATLAFYALMCYYMFRPMERNGYFDDEDYEEEEVLLQSFALEEDRV
ncbi:Protein CANDIDATE G-PROTEIN COUPLED RECEPTOR 6 [Hirschfeldia incana]|nr:Protein CANDIDATE G-PROTEIN COUPLED RECEPTOR 6 [Hirschfeldia incana]